MRIPILPQVLGVEDLAVDRDVDARGKQLQRTDGITDIEDGVAHPEPCGLHRAREHDGLAINTAKRSRSVGHGIGAVSDENAFGRAGLHGIANELPILIRHIDAVLLHQRGDLVAKGDVGLVQQLADLRLTHLEVALGIEVDLVDGAANGEYLDFHAANPVSVEDQLLASEFSSEGILRPL